MYITNDKVAGDDIIALLEEHLADMYATSPAESVHALDAVALQRADIQFFTARNESGLLGCVAVKRLGDADAELKSMRTAKHARGRGVGRALLLHALDYCRQQHFRSISLETGTQSYFAAAHRLYLREGFSDCGPFSSYQEDPNSRFMTLSL